ncbi:MAG: hypothetical protein H6828_09840 [Planctomycetes bacterium]|nr:hypothetical protein [Planctomycetota bacterium]
MEPIERGAPVRALRVACAAALLAGGAAAGGFVENLGQWRGPARFVAERGGARTWVTEDGLVLDLGARAAADAGRRLALRLELLGAAPSAVRGGAELPGRHHFLRGRAPEGWRTGARAFGEVVLEGAWPGVDLVLREGDAALEYDLHLAPGADLAAARVRVSGARGLRLEAGALVVATELGELVQRPPRSWTLDAAGAAHAVDARFVLLGPTEYGFEVPGGAPAGAWVLDPGVEWSTYLGAFDEDLVADVAHAWNGDVVVTGTTVSLEYPITTGAYDVFPTGGYDAFVTRLRADGTTLVYSTLLGGSLDDAGVSLAVGSGGHVWVAGDTHSPDFPIPAGAADPNAHGGSDVFVARLGTSGATLFAATYHGGAGDDHATELVLAPGSEPRIAGWTTSTTFSVGPNAFQAVSGGGRDAFVLGWSADLATLQLGSFYGGAGNDMARALAVGASGELVLVGNTSSANLPVSAGAFDTQLDVGPNSSQDGFACALGSGASTLAFGTYLGGSDEDACEGVARAANGELWLVGSTRSGDLPVTSDAWQPQLAGDTDAFVARLAANGGALLHAGYLGGADFDRALDLRVFADGALALVGETRSADFPSTPWAFDRTFNSPVGGGVADAFVARLAAGGALDYAGFLGGVDEDFAVALELDAQGVASVAGGTNSFNFPTTLGAWDRSYDLTYLYDGFVTRLDFARFPFSYGSAKVNSQSSWAALGFGGFPSLAAGAFTVYVDGGLPFGHGFLFWSDQPGGMPFMGGQLLMAPPYTRSTPLVFDWFGGVSLNVPVTPALVGRTRYYQAWYVDGGDPWGVGLSDGLQVTFYP